MSKICPHCTEKERTKNLSDKQVEIDLDLASLIFWRDITGYNLVYANVKGLCRGCDNTILLNSAIEYGDKGIGYFSRSEFERICRNVLNSRGRGIFDWEVVTLPLSDLVGAIPSEQLRAARG